jgi:hypothetical protein
MDLLKHRREKDINNQKLIQDILDHDMVQRYKFGSLAEMTIIRELMLDKIMNGKLNTQEDLEKYDIIKETLKEYFYVESLDQLDTGDYIRYLSFDSMTNDFELKKGGQFIKVSDNFIVLKGLKFNNMNTNPNEKASYWKITDKTPIFCKLNDNDKLILVLMEKTISA